MSGTLLLFGIVIFALVLGGVGCYLASSSEAAERKRRKELEARRMLRTPWYGRTPTG